MAVRNIKTSQAKKQKDAVRRAETASPVGFTSVTRGGLRIASQEGLTVQGSQRVTGTLFIDGTERVDGTLMVAGTLNVSGTSTVSGTMAVTGPLTVRGNSTFVGPLRIEGSAAIVGPLRIEGQLDITGTVTVSGPMTITGRLNVQGDVTFTGKTLMNGDTDVNGRLNINGATAIKGDTSLDGDVAVRSPGRVRVGTMTLNPNGGSVGLGALESGTSIEVTAPTLRTSQAISAGSNITANGDLIAGGARNTTNPPNVYMDASGRLMRSTA